MSDPVNQALVDFMKDCILFHEAVNNTSPLDTLFDLVKRETEHMTWLLCLIGEKLPQLIATRLHQYLILGFAYCTNPFLSPPIGPLNDERKNIVYMGDKVFSHLLSMEKNKQTVINSLLDLIDQYFIWIKNSEPLTADIQKFMLGYLLSLPKIAPALFNESWSLLFKRLFKNNAAGSMFLYEKNTSSSIVKHTSGEIQDISTIFPYWLTTIAFDSNGLIMKHAMDVAIMLDTLGHDDRLGLFYLIPTGDKSILDTLRPSLEKLDLKPTSIDLIDWSISSMKKGRGVDDLKIPLFLLQLVVLKKDIDKESVVDMFVQLIIRLDRPREDETCNEGARYLILSLVSSTEIKWPGIFQLVLESIFSRAIAMHIADSEGSVNVEKILSNLAMLFEEQNDVAKPGFEAFKAYLTSHWRQVLLLFLNHPSMECRAMGYRVLRNSRFWENTNTVEGCDAQTISKLLIDAWFRHVKSRYLRFGQEEEISVVEEQQSLVAHCCQNTELAKTMLSFAIDCILGGALEIFPTVDVNALQQEKLSLYDKIVREGGHHQPHHLFKKPPQFVTTIDFQKQEGEKEGFIDVRDEIYVDNIERTAALFFQFGELPTLSSDQYLDINRHILNRLSAIWAPNAVSLDTYDDVLPRNIPYQCDIAIGNAFKDHPVLFIIFEKYTSDHNTSTKDYPMTNDIIRSILVYFIVFWNMKEVVNIPTTLKFATQLEETTRLLFLLKPVLPEFLVNSYHVFPFMSAKDLGDILFQVIWYYLRWSNTNINIPGIKKVVTTNNNDELTDKCKKRLLNICENRLKVLASAPSWHTSLKTIMSNIDL
ncbi:hypothetical protein INT48_006507 [Thamnidium elegans]|uniref:Uncharacterized protein n=1 Tax=Thamnidium elegans TaxID=101142 RepID=A0A8H7SVF7_9FUNG|nr:hypothetical protein INT48_006507 [Thamnidium elegans]